MRFVETKKGTFEVMNNINGKCVAVSCLDYADVYEFNTSSENLTDKEIVEKINK